VESFDLAATFTVLEPGGTAIPVEVSPTLYEDLDRRFGGFHDRHVVSCHSFNADWPSWEMHPAGDEVVCLLAGEVSLVLDRDGEEEAVVLREPGKYVIVPKGVWHTAKVAKAAKVLFITPGAGTQTRPV
jgi:mannose-6-phosphate isomerase-like protein (cupin superfamily)